MNAKKLQLSQLLLVFASLLLLGQTAFASPKTTQQSSAAESSSTESVTAIEFTSQLIVDQELDNTDGDPTGLPVYSSALAHGLTCVTSQYCSVTFVIPYQVPQNRAPPITA